MGGGFSLDHEAMQLSIQNVTETNEHLISLMKTLMSNLEPLASTWRGDAAAAFLALKEGYAEDAAKMTSELNDIRAGLEKTRTSYQSVEEGNRKSVTQITSRLRGA